MTTLRVLLHVAAQHDYELHSLDFSTAFLQGTQWNLRRPFYSLCQAPRECHDTWRTTLAALGFAPATAELSLFLYTDTLLLPFYVLVYADDLVFATTHTEALTLVKSEMQKRHTCTDVLQRFGFQFSSPQPTPLSTSHSLSAPPLDESVELSGPYPELVVASFFCHVVQVFTEFQDIPASEQHVTAVERTENETRSTGGQVGIYHPPFEKCGLLGSSLQEGARAMLALLPADRPGRAASFASNSVPPEVPSDARAASPSVAHLLATSVTDPSFESSAASALVGELLDFVAACRLDYATALVAESDLHEEIWLRRPRGFTGSFPAGTQWSLSRPVYGLRQAPREWPDTLRTTLAALGFTPSTADPSLFLRTDTSLPPFYVLLYLGLQITRDRARRTITLTQSHMVHHVLQRFGFQFFFATSHSSVYRPLALRSTFGRVRRAECCEAEIHAGAMAAQELRWLTYLLNDLGEQPRSPPVLYVYNKAMIALCQQHRLEHRRKHIAMQYFLASELQQCGQLRLAYVATRANTADVFTKALPPGDHQRFSTVLGLVPTFLHLLTA
ncbi:unnamed protein product [Closterium sp. NIES-54]